MSKELIAFDRVREALISAFPELWQSIEATFGDYHNLREETPEAYPIFEDVVQGLVFELLESGRDQALLRRLFLFFEDMANSPDPNVSRDLLGIAILEPLVYKRDSLRQAWPYMGSKTKEMARSEARQQNREQDLPLD
jgi:hypothetical protein